jgi:motility quorum-sensing regulator/GCU-specific mRNA interferase toxin
MLPSNPGEGNPAYALELVQQLVGQGPVSCLITSVARVGARDCGFWAIDDIVEAILALSPANFYKTMEAEKCPGLWQDVYHSEFRGMDLYIKLQISSAGTAVVVQFKKR